MVDANWWKLFDTLPIFTTVINIVNKISEINVNNMTIIFTAIDRMTYFSGDICVVWNVSNFDHYTCEQQTTFHLRGSLPNVTTIPRLNFNNNNNKFSGVDLSRSHKIFPLKEKKFRYPYKQARKSQTHTVVHIYTNENTQTHGGDNLRFLLTLIRFIM